MGGTRGRLAVTLVVMISTVGMGSGRPASAHERGGAPPIRVIDMAAVRHIGGVDRPVEVLVVVRAGEDDASARAAALRSIGASAIEPADITAPPLPWIVSRLDFLHQAHETTTVFYNPTSQPYAAAGVVTAAEQDWTDVATSRFSFADGGTRVECLSVIGACPMNGIFTVGWGHLGTNILGVTDGQDVALALDFPTSATCSGDDFWLKGIVAHELGHVAGLEHATLQPTVMQAEVPFDGQYCGPQPNDADGLAAAWPEETTEITGQVTDAASGAPLPGAALRLDRSFDVIADDDGHFTTTIARGIRVVIETDLFPEYTNHGLFTIDDPTESLSLAMTGTFASTTTDTATVPEGGSTTARVHLLAPADHAVSGTLVLSGSGIGPLEGVAVDDVDFDAVSEPFSLAPGETDFSVPIVTFDDGFAEGPEIIQAVIPDLSGAAALHPLVTTTILDDEQLPVPTVTTAVTIAEGGPTRTIRVDLVGGDPRDESLMVSVTGIGAPAATATFADIDFHSTLAGEIGPTATRLSFPISAIDDGEYEGPEQAEVAYHVLGQDLTSHVTVTDNDAAPPIVAGPFRVNLASGYSFTGAGLRSLVDQSPAQPGLQVDVTVNSVAGVARVYARSTSVSDGGVAVLAHGPDDFTVGGGFSVGGVLFVSGDSPGGPTFLTPSTVTGSAAALLQPNPMVVIPPCAAGTVGAITFARVTVPPGFPAPSHGYIDVDPAPGLQIDAAVVGVATPTGFATQIQYLPFNPKPFVIAKIKGALIGGGAYPPGNVVAFTINSGGSIRASTLDFAGLTRTPITTPISGNLPC